ncbi:hypothetical protein [Streptomyces sp. CNQ085]|uniref:hypothetical protein n=1 Tax=Streptomyces sp. CNQ085 TaxID=2886944 RepID=UPI001F50A8CA|nr:hypothetical protein [Streptomyces sp. CNQ085]MCI0386486.1 hypothetical protein [Streptomyces sp. CNQ085]
MKFRLEVDMDEAASAEESARELGRILRYWGGNLHHYALRPGDGSAVYDSGYREVGRWSITSTGSTDPTDAA